MIRAFITILAVKLSREREDARYSLLSDYGVVTHAVGIR